MASRHPVAYAWWGSERAPHPHRAAGGIGCMDPPGFARHAGGQMTMQYSIHRPRSPLNGPVDYLWALNDAPAHARERIVPSGTMELVINLDEDELRIYDPAAAREGCRRFRGALVSGCYSAPFEVDTREHAS